MFSSPRPTLFEDQVKKNKMGRAGGMRRGQERKPEGKRNLQDLGVDGRIILK